MKYDFQTANHIDDYLAAIAGVDEFFVKDEGGIKVINYMFNTPETFPNPMGLEGMARRAAILRRDCRGLKFDAKSGLIIAKPYHKFFNANQNPESQVSEIEWSRPHMILEKLDGSMITFYADGNKYWAHTKMGATDVAMPVLKFVLDGRMNYLRLYDAMREEGLTAIFEWCSRQQRIVIDYPTEKLVLTAIRENLTGQYRPYAELVELGKRFDVPVVRALDGSAENIQQFLLEAKDLEGAEGYVIRFEDGHMVKVKGLWYMRIHNTKELFLFEKNVWTMVLKDELDDASPFMEEGDKAIVEKFAFELEHRILQKAAELNDFILRAKSKVADKKAFALEIVPGLSKLEKSLGFKLWDGHDAKLLLRDFLSKNVGTQRAVDEVRDLVGGLKWGDFYFNATAVED